MSILVQVHENISYRTELTASCDCHYSLTTGTTQLLQNTLNLCTHEDIKPTTSITEYERE